MTTAKRTPRHQSRLRRDGQPDNCPPPSPPKLSGQGLPLKAGQALQRGIYPYEPHEKRETNNEKRFYLISPISSLFPRMAMPRLPAIWARAMERKMKMKRHVNL